MTPEWPCGLRTYRQEPVRGPAGLSGQGVYVVVGVYFFAAVLRGIRTSACTSSFVTHVEARSPPKHVEYDEAWAKKFKGSRRFICQGI